MKQKNAVKVASLLKIENTNPKIISLWLETLSPDLKTSAIKLILNKCKNKKYILWSEGNRFKFFD